ncbi:MAG: ABC transporter permease [Proteobacteria bacterium]|nr:ABC transporter permease [Pseudomonadota bacterium]
MSVARLARAAAITVAYVLIVAPIAVVVVTAFSPTDFFVFPPPGLSLRWFVEFFRLDNMRGAFLFSLEVALIAATVASVLGTAGALFLARRRGAFATVLQGLFLAPLVFPTIILGLALLLLYKSVGMPVLPGLLFAHAVVGMPYSFRTTLAGLQGLDPALEEAGQSLGAGPLRTLALITLPLIWPSVLSGWLFAFIVSFGELNTALFLTGPGQTTLPIEIFSYLQFQGSQLVIAAASALQVGLIILMVAGIERIVGIARIVRAR